jgi:CheY-like chemotaxis protein
MAASASGSSPNPSSSDGDGGAAAPRDERARLAHDMRNALSPMRSALELLRLPQVGDAVKDEARAVIGRQIDRLSALIDRVAPRTAPPQRRPEAAAPVGAAPGPAAHAARCRVLLVDDNRLFLESGAAMLEAHGWEVRTAGDGAQALPLVREWRPRIVLLDLGMGGMGGLETARRLRAEHGPDALALVMTSGVELTEIWLGHARAAGFDDCLEKTAPPDAWLAMLGRYAQPK